MRQGCRDDPMRACKPERLLAGAGKAEITPSLAVGLLMSSREQRWAPFRSVRLPLYARAVALQRGENRVVLVSFDSLGLAGAALGGWTRFQRRICAAAGGLVEPPNLILTATHTHTAPETLALTDLPKETAFQRWVAFLVRQTGAAIRQALGNLRACRLVAGRAEARFGIYRRILTTRGVALSNEAPDPAIVIPRTMPVDNRVNIAALVDDAERIVAWLVNATCHPIHEMCLPQVSPDYPGEMSLALERRHRGAIALFFNGCAGNINPTVSCGGPGNARAHGLALAAIAEKTLRTAVAVEADALSLRRRAVLLPARRLNGRAAKRPVRAELAALRIGQAAFLFLPGEPFVETGLAIRNRSPFRHLFIVGYAGNTVGYIPTDAAFDEGGYEIGPGKWSYLARGCEPRLRVAALRLLKHLARGRTNA